MKLKLGTDCSGMDAPYQALKQLIEKKEITITEIDHIFSSDIDKHCRDTILANSPPKILFNDIFNREIKEVPDIDMYVAGFPCQNFSIAGKKEGFSTKRGIVFFECFKVIKEKQPKIFVLENVKHLLKVNKGESFKVIWGELTTLINYTISYKVLDTKDYGIPQSRTRLYIVGIRKDVQNNDFVFPDKTNCKELIEYVDFDDTHVDKPINSSISKGVFDRIPDDSIFINLSFCRDSFPQSNIICPCITASSIMWNVIMNRYMNDEEKLKLQGFNTNFKKVVSNRQFSKQLGNTMSINVLKALFKNIFKCVNLN